MSLNNDITTSAEWLNACNARINGATLGDSKRNRVSAALLHLALEHHGAIQLLISDKPHPHYGPAFALLRPQFEAYLRGVWLHRCACEQELAKFIKNDKLPRIDELIKAIETLPGYEEGRLRLIKQSVWKIMCGYTHGGIGQVSSRIRATEISYNYTEGEVREKISLACSITLCVSVAFAQLLNNNTMENEILSAYKQFFPQ